MFQPPSSLRQSWPGGVTVGYEPNDERLWGCAWAVMFGVTGLFIGIWIGLMFAGAHCG